MTDINHQLSVVAAGLNLANSGSVSSKWSIKDAHKIWLILCMSHTKVFNNTLLNRFSSWLQGTIIFPNGVAISGAFWIAYAFDPELAYNSWDHRYRPFYLCHVQHSFILLFSTLEALFRPHRNAKNLSHTCK